MNTQPHTQNPQVQQQIAQAKMLEEIVNRAGLNGQNPEHNQIAQQAIQDLLALQDPAREKELTAQMQAFGMQPEEIARNAQALQTRFTELQNANAQLDQQGEALIAKGDALGEKVQKKKGLSRIIGAVTAVAAGVGTFFTKLGGEKKKFSGKKIAVAVGLAALGGLVGTLISSVVTVKPLQKEGEALSQEGQQLDMQKGKVMPELQQVQQQAQQFNQQVFIEMAARMSKERVARTAEVVTHQPTAAAPPVVSTAPAPVPATAGFAAAHANTPNPQEQILNQTNPATSPEAVQASKEAAAAAGVNRAG